jgi:hypothetical protein
VEDMMNFMGKAQNIEELSGYLHQMYMKFKGEKGYNEYFVFDTIMRGMEERFPAAV